MHDFLAGIFHSVISSAHAESLEHVISEQAPGLTWNMSAGQIVQIVVFLVPFVMMWNKGTIRHAMQTRDISDLRRDISGVNGRLSAVEDSLRQLPSIIAGVTRASVVQNTRHGFRVANPGADAMPIEDSDREFAEQAELALRAAEKLAGRE